MHLKAADEFHWRTEVAEAWFTDTERGCLSKNKQTKKITLKDLKPVL